VEAPFRTGRSGHLDNTAFRIGICGLSA
jgi:hypothetical protein